MSASQSLITRLWAGVQVEWALFLPAATLSLIGILTMNTFGQGASLAHRQLLWLAIASVVYLSLAHLDLRFIRQTPVIMVLYGVSVTLLVGLLLFVEPVKGAQAWFSFGSVSFQPADLAKFALIILLAKYLSRRHVEIGDARHIVVSGVYTLVFVGLVIVQPDMGNAIILSGIWLGMMLVSGISKKHLAVLGLIALVVATALWFGGLKPYQRTRIVSFINPAHDIHGAGYNAYQAEIAVGSGGLFGKGIGYGTQSKLRFLPEYQTDFIFAAFAEEWGFVGVVLLLGLYLTLFSRLLQIARAGATNFDTFFTLGTLILLSGHLFIHTGINLGLLPVTGTTIPFMSAGGSHLMLEFASLGIVTSLARYSHGVTRDLAERDYVVV